MWRWSIDEGEVNEALPIESVVEVMMTIMLMT